MFDDQSVTDLLMNYMNFDDSFVKNITYLDKSSFPIQSHKIYYRMIADSIS